MLYGRMELGVRGKGRGRTKFVVDARQFPVPAFAPPLQPLRRLKYFKF